MDMKCEGLPDVMAKLRAILGDHTEALAPVDDAVSRKPPNLAEASDVELAIALILVGGRVEAWGHNEPPKPGLNEPVDILIEAARRLIILHFLDK